MLDKHKRFYYNPANHTDILYPEISKFLIDNGLFITYPFNKNFAICLTHDIDNIYPSLKYKGYSLLKLIAKTKLKQGYDIFLNKENPYWCFRDIIKLEEKYNALSSFYFMADNSIYNILDLKEEICFINDKKFEIGLHGGYDTYINESKMLKEKHLLEDIVDNKIIGYRNHFVRFEVPLTWKLLEKCGFKYDTTFAYADMIGFRNGMCHPFYPCSVDGKTMNILEIPFNIMDGTLRNYMRLDTDKSFILCKKLIDTVAELNGVLTIIWHNNYFDDTYSEKWKGLYKKILDYAYGKKAWFTSCKNIYEWYNENNFFGGI